MKCPGCAAEVVITKDACPSCGVSYLEAFERRAASRSTRTLPVRTPPRWPYLAGAAVLVVGAVLGWMRVGAQPLPAGALVAPAAGVAFVPPAGWTLDVRPDGVAFTQGPAGLRLVGRPGRVAPESLFNGSAFTVGAPEPATLAGLDAARVPIIGERAALPGAPQSVEWRGWLLRAESGGRTYAVAAWSESADFERRKEELEAFARGVRLTD